MVCCMFTHMNYPGIHMLFFLSVSFYSRREAEMKEREKGSLSTLKRPEIWDFNLDQHYNGIIKEVNCHCGFFKKFLSCFIRKNILIHFLSTMCIYVETSEPPQHERICSITSKTSLLISRT